MQRNIRNTQQPRAAVCARVSTDGRGRELKQTERSKTRRKSTLKKLRNRSPVAPNVDEQLKRETTAFHEAGHAVMAVTMGVAVRSVTAVPDEDAWGRTIYEWEFFGKEKEPHPRDRVPIQLAGNEAERLHYGRRFSDVNRMLGIGDVDEVDQERALEDGIYALSDEDEEDVWVYLERIRKNTRRKLRDCWPLVEAVAKRLMVCRSLSATELNRMKITQKKVSVKGGSRTFANET